MPRFFGDINQHPLLQAQNLTTLHELNTAIQADLRSNTDERMVEIAGKKRSRSEKETSNIDSFQASLIKRNRVSYITNKDYKEDLYVREVALPSIDRSQKSISSHESPFLAFRYDTTQTEQSLPKTNSQNEASLLDEDDQCDQPPNLTCERVEPYASSSISSNYSNHLEIASNFIPKSQGFEDSSQNESKPFEIVLHHRYKWDILIPAKEFDKPYSYFGKAAQYTQLEKQIFHLNRYNIAEKILKSLKTHTVEIDFVDANESDARSSIKNLFTKSYKIKQLERTEEQLAVQLREKFKIQARWDPLSNNPLLRLVVLANNSFIGWQTSNFFFKKERMKVGRVERSNGKLKIIPSLQETWETPLNFEELRKINVEEKFQRRNVRNGTKVIYEPHHKLMIQLAYKVMNQASKTLQQRTSKNGYKLIEIKEEKFISVSASAIKQTLTSDLKLNVSSHPLPMLPNLAYCLEQILDTRLQTVVDPCAGWGDRALSAMTYRRENNEFQFTHYLGVDPNSALHDIYKNMVQMGTEEATSLGLAESLPKINFICSTQEEVVDSDTIWDQLPAIDLVYTSPPYGVDEGLGTERYGLDDPNQEQSYRRYTTLQDWKNGFLGSLAKYITRVRPGGVLAINMTNNELAPDICDAFNDILKQKETDWNIRYIGCLLVDGQGNDNNSTFHSCLNPVWVWQRLATTISEDL